ncbi:MAG: hypothetical protein AAGF12_11960 [Myxococcota bacterium]
MMLAVAGCGRTTIDDGVDERPDSAVDAGCRTAGDCDDGLVCNGAERCEGGACLPGAPLRCDDGVDCTDDRCREAAGGCESLPDSSRCLAGELCVVERGCAVVPCERDQDCNDGFLCNGTERCGSAEVCLAGRPLVCEDGVSCTRDECSEAAGGCSSRPDHGRCDDGSFCNGRELCTNRGCVPGEAVQCNDGDRCTEDRCDDRSGRCSFARRPDPMCVVTSCPSGDVGTRTGAAVARGSSAGASNAQRGTCGGDAAPDRSFLFTAPRDGTWYFDTFGSSYDTVLYVMSGCGGAELPGACNDDQNGSVQSEVAVELTAGAQVLVVIDGFGSDRGDFILNVSTGLRPETGFCADGADNDGDGFIDCLDVDCRDDPSCRPPCTSSEVRCADGLDDDCDMLTDCDDADCSLDPTCLAPCAPFEFACGDRVDEDCDRLVDCADPDCTMDPACATCTPRGTVELACGDGRDDDCDGFIDCVDVDCGMDPRCSCTPVAPVEIFCGDGRDDDCNGRSDCADPRCASRPACRCTPTEMTESRCGNGLDDDCNGTMDCADPACGTDPGCRMCVPRTRTETRCRDGLDDDCNGAIDCADPACTLRPACCTPRPEDCRNGIDDDCDGAVDCADPECQLRPACGDAGGDAGTDRGPDSGLDGGICRARELGVAMCTDGADNDCDTRQDCADPDCSPFGPLSECCDGTDNDADGFTDLFTCRCGSDADCVGVGTLDQVCWTRLFSVCAPRCNFYGGDSFCQMLAPTLRCDAMTGQCSF